MKIPFTLENLAYESCLALAKDEEVASLASEIQGQSEWKVYLGLDPKIDKSQIPAPLAVLSPLSETQAMGTPKSMHVVIGLWLQDAMGEPQIINKLIVMQGPVVATRFADAVESALRRRFDPTDARNIVFDKQFDFSTWFESGLMHVNIDMGVEQPKTLGRSFWL